MNIAEVLVVIMGITILVAPFALPLVISLCFWDDDKKGGNDQ